MAKAIDDYFFDGFLSIVDDCDFLAVCSAQPANKAGVAAVTLASTALTPGAGNGDFGNIQDGGASGRRIAILQQSGLSITSNGDANHVSLDNGTNLIVTTCTPQTLTAGGTVTVPLWEVEIRDPV